MRRAKNNAGKINFKIVKNMIFVRPLTKKDMPFFSKWTTYYYNHQTDPLHCLFLSNSNIKVLDTMDKRNHWYQEYKEPTEEEDDIYVWYIIYEWNMKTDLVHKIGAVNFSGDIEECETLFFLIPKFKGRELMVDGYREAEENLFEKYKVKYIWGEAENKGSANVFKENWFNNLKPLNDYYKYTEDYYL